MTQSRTTAATSSVTATATRRGRRLGTEGESLREAGQRSPIGALAPYDAVLFDLGGVVADTAELQAEAWQQLLDPVLARHPEAAGAATPFDPVADYRRYFAGRPGPDGVTAFLADRGITLPAGEPGDQEDIETVASLAARHSRLFLRAIEQQGVRSFPGTSALLDRLAAGGVPAGLVTTGGHATSILAAAGLADSFDVVIDGTADPDLRLPGRPDPALLLEATRRLGRRPDRVAVVDDDVAGIQAGRAGGLGLVVGVDRGGNRAALEAAGADVVVGDVEQLDLGALRAGPWQMVYEGIDPAHESHREALTALGNGYLVTRGAAPERPADGVHYPGTYLAGVYNRLVSSVQGRDIETEHLVNAPNWLPLDVSLGLADTNTRLWWSSGGFTVAGERRELDLRCGLLVRRLVLIDAAGRRLQIRQRRLVSMARPHVAALETTLTAEGWSGPVVVRSGQDGGVQNTNVAADAALAHQHWTGVTAASVAADTVVLQGETSNSRIRVAVGARTTVSGAPPSQPLVEQDGARVDLRFELQLTAGQPVVIDKTVAFATSRDWAIASPTTAALAELARPGKGVSDLLPDHVSAWQRLWHRFQIELDADAETQLVLNLHTFHLLQSLSPHTAGLDAGVTARGLHGEGYRGHVFWDELFVLPLITLRMPELARALLNYRWRRLDAARDAARQASLNGALFPWQSGSDGREETPRQLFNPRSQRSMPDNSALQHHVGLAVAVNTWRYYQLTGDDAWLAEYGAELIVEVARLFASLARYEPGDLRFHISGVMGPDEYHDGYPDAPGQGVRDNAYTNVLAAWVCQRADDALTVLQGHQCDDLRARLGVDDAERVTWLQLSRRLAVPFHDDGIISQFDGYERLAEFDWDHYRRSYGNVGRLDLILEAEGDSTNRYKLSKQADVAMLLYLLGAEDLSATLDRLGYPLAPDTLARTVAYYLARTAHGSTLSRVVHAAVLAEIDPAKSWEIFREALVADLDDTQGGTTGEGIHLGAMAGTVEIILRTFAGLRAHVGRLHFNPQLPVQLRSLRFQVRCRGQLVEVALDSTELELYLHPCSAAPLSIAVRGVPAIMRAGERRRFPWRNGRSRAAGR